MRIISGKYQGIRFKSPKNSKVRPTTDFAKESLFNILNNQFDFDDLTVLDLFGGTGNISFEFGSRAAKNITLIEKDFKQCKFIRNQSSEWGLPIRVINGDVFKILPKITSQYDIIFADPPYELQNINELPNLILKQNILATEGVLIIEHGKETNFENHPNFKSKRTYSRVNFSFFEPDC